MVFQIPDEFGYVVITVATSWLMNTFLTVQVAMARKKFNVQYPALYAEKGHAHADEFNCVQRAHQNTLESWGPVTILALVNGLVYPVVSAGLFALWQVGRIIYGIGYAKGGPTGRMAGGIISHLGDLPLFLMAFYSGAVIAKLV
mmetsp:Transcript_52737/g.115630  ORF Transcript_52737/g.115630 Transcript_52737/m.115630 type:complete len:144 (+) Transcript_52737:43-474(+)